MKRRNFLSLSAATTVVAFPAIARAQTQRFAGITLRMNGYGGDFDRLIQEHISLPLERKTGLKVTCTPGSGVAAMAKLIASPQEPPFDIVMLDSPLMPDILKAQVTTRVVAADVKAISRLSPGVREFGDFGIPIINPSVVLAYNANRVKPAPKSYADLARADLKDRVGLFNLENNAGLLQLIALADANGGSVDNIAPGFAALAKFKSNIVSITPSTVNMLQLFEQEEVWAGANWDGRVYSLQKAGRPIAMTAPSEGSYSLRSYLSPVKGTKHPEAVNAFLQQALSDEFIGAMSGFFGYWPVTDVKLPADIAKTLFRPTQPKSVDWAKVSANRVPWVNQFNKQFR